MDNSMLQALADYMKVKPPTPFKLQRQNGVTKYADYEFEGKVIDKAEQVFIEVDGYPIEVKNGKFICQLKMKF